MDVRRALPELESLESRRLLYGGGFTPTSPDVLDAAHGPMANAGTDLINIYKQYQNFKQEGGRGSFRDSLSSTERNAIYFGANGTVGVSILTQPGADLNALQASLRNLGMSIGGSDANFNMIEGQLPIDQLPAVAKLPAVVGLHPLYAPKYFVQGSANDQGEQSLKADVAKTQSNVNGSGVTVGVISDSVNRFPASGTPMGLAQSVSTGDLPKNPDGSPKVNVLLDNMLSTTDAPGADTDEGRAMLEEIYDVAPGANLAFHTNLPPTAAGLGGVNGLDIAFATAIRALATQGKSNIIVDDVGIADEPYYQDGLISQAITDVTRSNGVVYFSAAGNSGNHGFESPFRGVQATVGSVSGRFMNFNPGGGTTTMLPITVTTPGVMIFNYDQPVGNVTSNVNISIVDSSGAVVNDVNGNPAQGSPNKISGGRAQDILFTPAAGNYFVVVQVADGSPDPGRIQMAEFSADMTFSTQFGNAGGITYPTTFGHATSPDAIGVGAVPFWVVDPFQMFTPTPSEGFSSFGPAYRVFAANGTRLPSVVKLNKPDVSGIDGINTSFFPGLPSAQANDIDTTNPPPGTGPATTTDQDKNPAGQIDTVLPNFFGTSAAAPNLAAVAALMEQLSPGSSTADVRAAMIKSAIPLNGTTAGAFDVQGGFGLVQAPAALQAIDKLRVVSTTPTAGQAATSAPKWLLVNFSRPLNGSTLDASDLQFTQLPPGVTVTVGRPIYGPNPNSTLVAFPLTFNVQPGSLANGTYAYTIASGSISSSDNRPLVGYSSTFALNDVIPPRITNTIFAGRVIVAQFSEPVNPATVNKGTVLLVRTGSSGVFSNPTNVIVTSNPNAIVHYDVANNRVIFDLTRMSQSDLPTDNYAVVITDSVTDLVGNRLDGEFSSQIFPSGNGVAGGSFVQYLPAQQVTAPQIAVIGLDPASDTGITGDQGTNLKRPTITGRVIVPFPGSVAGATVVAEFNSLHSGVLDLGRGQGNPPRGFAGTFDVATTTDGSGRFSITPPVDLPEGLNTVRLVVVGQPDIPPQAGLSSALDTSIRVDRTAPTISGSSLANGANIGGLSNLSLFVTDPVAPQNLANPLAVPKQLQVPALDPARASNVSNYSLYNLGPDGKLGTPDDINLSSKIVTATYVDTSNRTQTNSPFTGRIDLTFAPGLPAGKYVLVARAPQAGFQGITDAAGNPLNDPPGATQGKDFGLTFTLQPTPVFITRLLAYSNDPVNGQIVYSGPRSFYETPAPGFNPRAEAPPIQFYIDFSTTLPLEDGKGNPIDYSNAVQLYRSANGDGPAFQPDGDFGDLGIAGGTGVGSATRVAGTTVTLVSSNPLATSPTDPGFFNRLILRLAPRTALPPDFYRLYIPNAGANAIFDIYGNQLDGELLGNPTASGSANQTTASGFLIAPTDYQTLMPNGQVRGGLSGDGVQGGAFMTGYTVVAPQSTVNGADVGNIIYTQASYIDNPSLSSDDPDGSMTRPYPALAPEARPNQLNGGDLNSSINFGTNFDPRLDLNGNGHFDRSALFAASQVQTLPGHAGPVVVVALPSPIDPTTNVAQPFVIQDPAVARQDPDVSFHDASVSVPANTVLTFAPSSVVKLYDASIYVQYQGSAVSVMGGPNPSQRVTFTSYLDDRVGGDTNGDGLHTAPNDPNGPNGGDWGGFLIRNFDDTSNGGRAIPISPGPLDPNRPKLGISGAQDALTSFNFAQMFYGGGAVPQTSGYRFDVLTLYNSRPSITNSAITVFNQNSPDVNRSAQAGISADVDSFREDDLTRGPLIRNTTVTNSSLNGIYIRANSNAIAQPTDAIDYPNNPTSMGGVQNYSFDDPLPHLLTTTIEIGTKLLADSGGQTVNERDRFYIQPGMMFKFNRGAAMELLTPGASLNVGDRTYINQFDLNPNLSPTDPGFRPQNLGDARVLFTSLFDDNARTQFIDPNTQQATTIVAPLDSDNGGAVNLPTPGSVPTLARWGDVTIQSGGVAVIDEADFQYGGGQINEPSGTTQRDVLAFVGAGGFSAYGVTTGAAGTRAYITNNNFFDNANAAMSIDPNGLLAADPTRPLSSGNPFFRGNVMQRNDLNGLEVLPDLQSPPWFGFVPNLFVDSVWDDTDLTYILRGTVKLNGAQAFNLPQPSLTSFQSEQRPFLSLTLQSSLPDALLADGSHIARPGEPLLIKLLNTPGQEPLGDGATGFPTGNIFSDTQGGAGFLVGFDDGSDPPTDPALDAGAYSQIRITGIGGNETTGQQRVPVIITSLHDSSVGTTVRGVAMNQAISGDTTAPKAGDGGVIGFGGLSLTDYNLFDPRDGNIIDNADIRYLTRVEMQGGGIVDVDPAAGTFRDIKLGVTPSTQLNASKAMTISNSNLSDFSQVGVLAHASFLAPLERTLGPGGYTFVGRTNSGSFHGQPINLFMVNNTVANMPVGVRIDGERASNSATEQEDVTEFVPLNNTFYNNGVAVHIESIAFNGTNSVSHVHFTPMDNIFANSTTAAIETVGQIQGSQAQYNLFFNNAADINSDTGLPNFGAVSGDPMFRDAKNGDFNLTPGSAAIDAARSELLLDGQTTGATEATFHVIADQVLDARGGIRNSNARAYDFLASPDPGNYLALPGFILRSPGQPPKPLNRDTYYDQWVPAIPGSPGAIPGPASNPGGVFSYKPITGERDQRGFLRQDDPAVGNVGTGRNPFFDIGAYEFRQLNPPEITAVTATVVTPGSPNPVTIPIYQVGGIAGTNRTPQTIQITFNKRIDPSTITGAINTGTVQLVGAGPDQLLDTQDDRKIDLSGKLSFDPTTNVLTINFGQSNVTLPDDLYRLEVFGSGQNVIRDPQGLALDGENTVGGLPTGQQKALPSGDGFPGGNFFMTFTIDTHPPAVSPTPGVQLAASSDTGVAGDNITDIATPTFTGTITDTFPPANSVVGQTVIVDVSTRGDGVFDVLNAGTATTGANGVFNVTVTKPLPDSPYNVGPDGILGTADDTGYSIARIRVVDQAGNVSNPNDPNARVRFVVDTKGPRIGSTDPLPNTQASVGPGGVVHVAILVNENLNLASLSGGGIQVVRAGGDGVFGNGNDIPLSIDPGTITVQYLNKGTGGPGSGVGRFDVTGVTVNDLYRVTLLGSGAAAVTDVAGNALDGEFTGAFPTGDGTPGGDFNLDFVVYNPAFAKTVWVNAAATTNGNGSRTSPFQTITAGLNAAGIGDTVAVLPGVYTEAVTMKSLVRLVSADSRSTAGNIVPGNALKTIIRAPVAAMGSQVTLVGSNLVSIPNFETEISGFTIASPLMNDPANGPINPKSSGVFLTNSDVLFDKNYVIDSGIGVAVVLSGSGAVAPTLQSNGLIGNVNGLVINDTGLTGLAGSRLVELVNNDIAFNTNGAVVVSSGTVTPIADFANNIFWQNADNSGQRNGMAIYASAPGRVTVRDNLFAANGPNIGSPADDTVGVGGGFDPGALSSVPDALGNITGDPGFVRPLDPRPDGQGEANFILGANFDLKATSAAIDNALQAIAPATDFLSRGRVDIPNVGLSGRGPADIGAFEFNGSGGINPGGGSSGTPISGGFVSNSSLANGGQRANGATVAAPTSIWLAFSHNINPASVLASDLVLTGAGLNPLNPARPVRAVLSDAHTIRFDLTGGFLPGGLVQLSIAGGAILDTAGNPVDAYTDTFRVGAGSSQPPSSGQPVVRMNAVQTASSAPSVGQAVQAQSVFAPAPTPPAAGPVPGGPLSPARRTTAGRGLLSYLRRR